MKYRLKKRRYLLVQPHVALSRWDYDFQKATMLNCAPGVKTIGECTEHTLDFVMLEGDQSSIREGN